MLSVRLATLVSVACAVASAAGWGPPNPGPGSRGGTYGGSSGAPWGGKGGNPVAPWAGNTGGSVAPWGQPLNQSATNGEPSLNTFVPPTWSNTAQVAANGEP